MSERAAYQPVVDAPHGMNLIDWDRLTGWMDAQGLGSGPFEAVTPLTGGSQNVLVRFRRDGKDFVLRRPPLHPTRNGSETMRREARVLAGLADTDVPHAKLIAACGEEDVIGAAFYLMEPVEGFNAALGLPALHRSDAGIRRTMGLEMASTLARISQVDIAKAGLSDFGRPEGFLERQIPHWMGQLEGYRKQPGWPGPDSLPGIRFVAEWLEANRPVTFTPGLMHGDYHFKNVMFSNTGPEIAAVVDWELTTIGDPMIDLGWLIATWRGPGGDKSETTIIVEPWDGFPEADELVSVYADATGRDVSAVSWYAVFACFKLGILLEGSYARALAGKAPLAIGERLHANVLRLLNRARRWIAEA